MIKLNGEPHQKSFTFFRYCEDCGNKFRPNTKSNRLCAKCSRKRFLKGMKNRRYK